MRAKHSLLLLLMLLANVSILQAQEDEPFSCPDTLPTQLQQWQQAFLENYQESRLYAEPSTSSELRDDEVQHTPKVISAEPVCAEGYLWQEVISYGTRGWAIEATADEYYLIPYNDDDWPFDCPDTLPSRVGSWDNAQVIPGNTNNLRAEPSTNAERLGTIPGEAVVNVLNGGPLCAEGYLWSEVVYDGVVGWTVEAIADEYWLQPYIPPLPEIVSRVEGDQMVIESDALDFTMDASLAERVTAELQIGYSLPGAMSPMPNYVYYTVFGYPIEGRADFAVYPVEPYRRYCGEYCGEIVDTVQRLVDERPAIPGELEELPYLPLPGAAQEIQAQARVLEFENGAGIRYLTYYTQMGGEVNPTFVFYTFQGVSADGEAYISADFAVEIDGEFPLFVYDQSMEDPGSDGQQRYLAEFEAVLDSLPPEAFTPRLETLDAMMESINVDTP